MAARSISESAIADVALVRSHLIAAARDRSTIGYAELLNLIGERFTRPRMRALCRTLDRIDDAAAAAGEPELAVLVVREDYGLPGQGWWTARREWDGAWTGPDATAHVRAFQHKAFDYWGDAANSAISPGKSVSGGKRS